VVSITKPFDGLFSPLAETAGIPVEDYTTRVVPEWIATGLEAVTDIFAKGWLNKLIQFIAGAIAAGYATWGKNVDPRLRRELLTIGQHELTRILDPKPQDIIELRESIENFVKAVQRGDWNAALASILRTPSEIKAMFGIKEATPAPPTPPALVAPPAPAPKPKEAPAPKATGKVDIEVF